MRVYRVGHRTALDAGFPSGPYTCEGLDPEHVVALWGMAGDHTNGSHPSPFADPLLKGIEPFERCGFDSREALDTWFEGWESRLDAAGFIVWEYDVPDWAARVGRNGQVVFNNFEAFERTRQLFKVEDLTLF
ncbi:hypothetical protein [Streptomyces kronopolitis]|uniref:hypothetical protein n=1 Tax=Streptomyces kronopolitis TaxID=1612435 RepID=UPI003D974EF9